MDRIFEGKEEDIDIFVHEGGSLHEKSEDITYKILKIYFL